MKYPSFLITVTKIIAYYSAFYSFLKLYNITSGVNTTLHILFCIVYIVISGGGFYLIKKNIYNWYYTLICSILLIVFRFIEPKLLEGYY